MNPETNKCGPKKERKNTKNKCGGTTGLKLNPKEENSLNNGLQFAEKNTRFLVTVGIW